MVVAAAAASLYCPCRHVYKVPPAVGLGNGIVREHPCAYRNARVNRQYRPIVLSHVVVEKMRSVLEYGRAPVVAIDRPRHGYACHVLKTVRERTLTALNVRYVPRRDS